MKDEEYLRLYSNLTNLAARIEKAVFYQREALTDINKMIHKMRAEIVEKIKDKTATPQD